MSHNLDDVLEAVLESYAMHPHITKIGETQFPKRHLILAVLKKLQYVIFPGFFDQKELRSDNIRFYTGQLLEEIRETLVGQLLDVLFGFGVLEDMLADESITEIMANGPHKVFFEREGKISPSDRKFADEAELRALVDRILGPLGRRIDERHRRALPDHPQILRTRDHAGGDAGVRLHRRSAAHVPHLGGPCADEHRGMRGNGQRQDDAAQRALVLDPPRGADRDHRRLGRAALPNAP